MITLRLGNFDQPRTSCHWLIVRARTRDSLLMCSYQPPESVRMQAYNGFNPHLASFSFSKVSVYAGKIRTLPRHMTIENQHECTKDKINLAQFLKPANEITSTLRLSGPHDWRGRLS